MPRWFNIHYTVHTKKIPCLTHRLLFIEKSSSLLHLLKQSFLEKHLSFNKPVKWAPPTTHQNSIQLVCKALHVLIKQLSYYFHRKGTCCTKTHFMAGWFVLVYFWNKRLIFANYMSLMWVCTAQHTVAKHRHIKFKASCSKNFYIFWTYTCFYALQP